MSLSCGCDEDYGWYYDQPCDYSKLTTKKRKRCCSCKKLIDISATTVMFKTWRNPRNDIEENIYGDDGEIPMANKYMCEICGDLYFNLTALKFCITLEDNMYDLLADYIAVYNPPKNGF